MKDYAALFFLCICLCGAAYAQTDAAGMLDEELLFSDSQASADVFFQRLHQDDEQDISRIDISLSAECEPLTTVAGCVNVVSGQFFQANQDLAGNTIDPLSLVRYYDSGSLVESFLGLGCGCQYPLIASDIQKKSRHSHAMISEREGFLVPYRTKEKGEEETCYVDPRLFQKGYTNAGRRIGAPSNLTNWKAFYQPTPSSHEGYWTVLLGDGSKRLYRKKVLLSKGKRQQLGLPTQTAYLLTEEIKPNGNKIQFSYQEIEGNFLLSKLQTVNRSNSAVLNSINLIHSADGCLAASSCGHRIAYQLQDRIGVSPGIEAVKKRMLKSTLSSQKGTVTYTTALANQKPALVQIDKPRGAFLKIEYDADRRVKSLQEPIGKNDESLTTHQFQYYSNSTKVWDGLKQLALYQFDSHSRLSQITYFDQQQQFVRQDVFEWSQGDGREGWLKSKSIRIGDAIFHLKSYQYDLSGNVCCETLYGNLTGEKAQTFTSEQKNSTDCYSLRYTYSKDRRNLVMSKATPEGLLIKYDYFPGTNLLTKELHTYSGRIQERKFQTYDKNGQLKLAIEDDGSCEDADILTGITYRRVKLIHSERNSEVPSFGKPKEILELCLDRSNGQMNLLKKTEFFYDEKGNETLQKVYNSKLELCYATAKIYDHRQLLVQEINPLGQTTHYEYDDSHNKTGESLYGSDQSLCCKTAYAYDLGNRLIRKEEHHQSGHVFVTEYEYNALNQLIAEIDAHGNRTTYAYDRMGNQTTCTKPAMQEPSGNIIHPQTLAVYNPLGQAISKTDERGLTTYYTYNSYGSPTQIHYPDESIERFIYYPSGLLKQKWQADGTSIHYVYDPKGRLLKEETLDDKGAVLKEESFTYQGRLLQFKTDAMGVVTAYHYDVAGRKVAEIIGNHAKATFYEYDDFDRVIKISRQINPHQSQIERYGYDWLDRVTSKTLEDEQGRLYAKETYTYDFQGKQVKKTVWQSSSQTAVYERCYDSDGTLLWQDNPLQQRTMWKHEHQLVNELNQRVHTRILIDALGRPIAEVDDAFHRLVKKDTFEQGRCLSKNRYAYDAAGNAVKKLTQVMTDGQLLREYAVLVDYDSRGRLIAETEMPAGKTTRYAYDQMGRLIRKDKPDGAALHYAYDALGRLKALASSDGSIAYTYRYDAHDNPIEVSDLVHQTTLKRTYDLLSRLIKEELSPGLAVHYTYDSLGRVTQLTLPDGSFIRYAYDACHLKKAERCTAFGQLVYAYDCESYDMAGRLLKGASPAGPIHYTYDLLGRTVTIQAAGWHAKQRQFDPVGNLLAADQKDPSGEFQEQFAYDRFNYLTQEKTKANQYHYDSLGNCVNSNGRPCAINALNQLISDGQSYYAYDANGNLIGQTNPNTIYTYDALNRLTCCEANGIKTQFTYDAFGRCLRISDAEGTKHLLYLGEKDIGCWLNGKLKEFRLVHPESASEQTFAIELGQEIFFPIQDHTHNICALQRKEGKIAQWMRYASFGSKTIHGEASIHNPWRFANRREVAGLLLFTHRFYNPQIRRWQTTDPIGFEDSLNLYQYVHNNPHCFRDPDGRCAFVIPFVIGAFGSAGITIAAPTVGAILGSAAGFAAGWAVYEVDKWYNNTYCKDDSDQFYAKKKTENAEGKEVKEPKYNGKELGDDPATCPIEGFEWQGKGEPGSKEGSWHNTNTKEWLRPDLDHPPPKGPHWDYGGRKLPDDYRLFLDGTWEIKL